MKFRLEIYINLLLNYNKGIMIVLTFGVRRQLDAYSKGKSYMNSSD